MFGQAFGEGSAVVLRVRQREGRDAAVHGGEAVQRERAGQPGKEALPESALVRDDGVPAERLDVRDGRRHAREQLVCLRAGFEALPERLVRRRTHLVRGAGGGGVWWVGGGCWGRAVELVGRADED